MGEGVEGQAAVEARCVVAELVGRPGMSEFVAREGNNKRDESGDNDRGRQAEEHAAIIPSGCAGPADGIISPVVSGVPPCFQKCK